jgi:hypothetical protein
MQLVTRPGALGPWPGGVRGALSADREGIPPVSADPRIYGWMRLTGFSCMAVVLSASLLAACDVTEPDKDEPYCAVVMRARLDGAWYIANGNIRVIPRYGDSLGTATVPPCEGEGGFSFEAFSIDGVKPTVAFASSRLEDTVFIAEGTHADLAWLPGLRREAACLKRDDPVSLKGPWLGILGPHHETEVDLVPPYNLSMRVDDASRSRYERTFLTIHVANEAGQPITQEDLRASLRRGGNLSVVAVCRDRDFWAEEVDALPPA